MLTSLHFEKYRSFLAPVDVPLGRKITLLYGYNNAGKSALLRGLVLLAASARAGRPRVGSPLALDHGAARAAGFRDLISNAGPLGEVRLGMSWAASSVRYSLREVFDRDNTTGQPVILGFETTSPDVQAQWIPNEQLAPEYETSGGTKEIVFAGLQPEGPEFARLREQLDALAASVSWLPATREAARDRYDLLRSSSPYTPMLPVPFLHREGQDGPVFRDVQLALGLLAKVELSVGSDTLGAYARFAPAGYPARDVAFSAVGEGIAHVLPVVTLIAAARRGVLGQTPLVAIEQPELHLHPAAELALMDIILTAATDTAMAPRFVLETHSEALLLSLQLAVAEGRILPEDVSVCWVSRDEDGRSSSRAVMLAADGSREGWPSGVFSENLEQARLVLRAGDRPRS